MRKSKTYLLSASLAIVIALAGCGEAKKEKVTEIPITTQSNDAKISLQQGLALLDQGDYQKARTFFVKAIEQDPKCGIAYVFKASTYESPKEFADDIASAKANQEGASEWEKLYCDYNETYLNNDWNKRLEVTQKIASLYPEAARAQFDLGYTYSSGNQEGKARECFQKAIELNPKWVGGYSASVISYLFYAPKDFKKAEEFAVKATELAPSSPGAEIALGDCYRAQNNLEKARDAYSKAITLDPNVAEAYYKKGHANSFLGKLDDARQDYTEAAKHDETKQSSYMNIANTYLYGGDAKTAMNVLTEKAAGLDASGESQGKITAGKFNLLKNCATIAMHNNDAAKLKEVVTAMEPLSAQIGNDLGAPEAKAGQKGTMLYWQSILAATEGNFPEATSKAEEIKTTVASITDPNKLDGYEFALGYISMKQKKYADAVSHFEKTQQNYVYNKYWLAVANDNAGNKDKANSLFKEISDYNFNEVGYALVRNEIKTTLASR